MSDYNESLTEYEQDLTALDASSADTQAELERLESELSELESNSKRYLRLGKGHWLAASAVTELSATHNGLLINGKEIPQGGASPQLIAQVERILEAIGAQVVDLWTDQTPTP